jgi:hypothetical protein
LSSSTSSSGSSARAAQQRRLRGVGERADPVAERRQVQLVAVPRIQIDGRDDLLRRRALEQPAGVGQADRVHREAELGLRKLRNHCLRLRQHAEQGRALRQGRVAHERDLHGMA